MKKATITFVLSFLIFNLNATEYIGATAKKNAKNHVGTAAQCNPPTASAELNINNTKALIQSGGDMWWDFNRPRYEIPAGSGKHSLYNGALWIAGQDVSGQFKVAAQRYRSEGVDFWTGPLSTVDADIDIQTCNDYDRHWETSKSMVQEFVGWYEASNEQKQKLYPGYTIPEVIKNWPAHGRNYAPYNEDENLAPFFDANQDNFYNPDDGDYPGYVLNGKSDCSRAVKDIYGDQNLWWVFNDKGNIHTESQGPSIGLEIRAQAFAFSATDEVNNMSFYNYEIINRSTFSLNDTYFGQWVDGDVGNSRDDFVGCDVKRGLGFFYNGDDNDEDANGALGYGNTPPAIGVDFFQGPFQENDNKDNCLCTNDLASAIEDDGIVYKGQGAGYGDNKVDNERYGMRKFVYCNNVIGPTGDPNTATEYYNMLRGIWKDGTPMTYGGTAYNPNDARAIPTHYMFPGNSDPENWGTDGVDPGGKNWSDETNLPNDRRFVQSSGPFRLAPGAVNNITVGVVWAQAQEGGRLASVEKMRLADDKTQALFDSCFEILDGPDAPDLLVQELDREIIIAIDNKPISNNYNESYAAVDPFMSVPDSVDINNDGVVETRLTEAEKRAFATFKFEGYQVFQLANASVGTSELEDMDRARLVAQVDIKNNVTRLINYVYDPNLKASIPKLMVDGENEGIRKSFQFKTDAFASGDARLINHKTYYYMAISYAYNRYGDGIGNLSAFEGEYDPNDPEKLYGQKLPYLASRKGSTGPVQVIEAIPHKTEIEFDGVELNANYGDGVELVRIEGRGNSNNFIGTSEEYAQNQISNIDEWENKEMVFRSGMGPVQVKVVDPLSIPNGIFTLAFNKEAHDDANTELSWMLFGESIDTVFSDKTVAVQNEQIIFDLGLSVTTQYAYPARSQKSHDNGYVGFMMEYEDATDQWLSGISDIDADAAFNWIKSGETFVAVPAEEPDSKDQAEDDHFTNYEDQRRPTQLQPDVPMDTAHALDPNQNWENIVNRTWAPFGLASYDTAHPVPLFADLSGNPYYNFSELILRAAKLSYTPSVDVVITKDKSLWTRCPVFEAQDNGNLTEGGAVRGEMRRGLSVDKEGRNQLDPNCNIAEATMDGTQVLGDFVSKLRQADVDYLLDIGIAQAKLKEASFGMGWFPGYAVDVSTGERLNMAFSEDSWLKSENGRDMVWNPTDKIVEPLFNELRFGGKHMIYVFRNNRENSEFGYEHMMSAYDKGQFAFDRLLAWDPNNPKQLLKADSLSIDARNGYLGLMSSAAWVGYPVLAEGAKLFGASEDGNEVTIRLRTAQPYAPYAVGENVLNLRVGETYYVDRGAIRIAGEVYHQGQSFVASAASFTHITKDAKVVGTVNNGLPMYTFNTENLAPTKNQSIGQDALSEILAVPNPYYAYSGYETGRLDYEMKVVNLPATCTVTIYDVSGKLIRSFSKDDATMTSIDWDLKNEDRVPIVSGLYIIHVDAGELGEKIVKWFGVMRPADYTAF